MPSATCSDLLKIVMAGRNLSDEQTHQAFCEIMDGQWSEAQTAGLLVALAAKGETAEEITGAARAMREHVVKIDTGGRDVIDTCGTGGTGLSTLNVSTGAAMIVAGAGGVVAKHGNRTNTRVSGSADVLKVLGVNLDADPATVSRCLAEANVGFCFAVRCHPAMKYAVPVRKSLGVRTIFNLLGPLTNPAGAKRQLMGVFSAELTETIATVLGRLGATRAMVVCSEDGLDEIAITAATKVSEFRDGQVSTRTIQPEDFGLTRATLAELAVETAEQSAEMIRAVLAGAAGPARDILTLNAAAALTVADLAEDIGAGLTLAADSIDTGRAAKALETLVAVSNR